MNVENYVFSRIRFAFLLLFGQTVKMACSGWLRRPLADYDRGAWPTALPTRNSCTHNIAIQQCCYQLVSSQIWRENK